MRCSGVHGLFLGLLAIALGGCSAPEPYVFRPSEFDRRVIGKVPAPVPGAIEICYSARGTKPEAIVRLAEEECAKYGKSAQFIANEVYNCPLSTPVAARYYCCPSPTELTSGFRCSATDGRVEWMTADEIRREKKRSATTPSPRY